MPLVEAVAAQQVAPLAELPIVVEAPDVPALPPVLVADQTIQDSENAKNGPEAAASTIVTAPETTRLTAAPFVLVDQEGADQLLAQPEAENVSEPTPPAAELTDALEADDLPAQAPAIRPPVEVGEARFEFGLADAPPALPVPTYELPGLVDEWASAAVTLSLGNPDTVADAAFTPSAAPAFTPAAFTGDQTVGYGFGESSRLGLSLQLLDLLAVQAEAAETLAAPAAQPAVVPVPPAGTFFEPDPLLLDHWATHRPLPPPLPSSLNLINNFLKRQPRLTRPAMLPPSPSVQADLSVRSTRAEPDLVSESLAKILARQGKTARAIEIYEKLMVKQPEKMAYFAAQIQSLQPSA